MAPASSPTPDRDDWAVHIALAFLQWPAGVTDAAVALPARGAWCTAPIRRLPAPRRPAFLARIAVSATRPRRSCRIRQTLAIQPVSIGSAGAKAMAVIDGYVDIRRR